MMCCLDISFLPHLVAIKNGKKSKEERAQQNMGSRVQIQINCEW